MAEHLGVEPTDIDDDASLTEDLNLNPAGITDILESIKELPLETDEQRGRVEKFLSEIENKINELNKVKIITPAKFVDLGRLTYFSSEFPQEIEKIGNKIYILSSRGKFYANDLETGEIKEAGEFNLGRIKSDMFLKYILPVYQSVGFAFPFGFNAGRPLCCCRPEGAV